MAWDWESGQCYVEGGAFEDIMSWGLSESSQKEEEDSTSALIPLPCLPSPPSSEQSIGTGSFHNKATDGSFDSSLNEGFCLGGPKQGTSPLRRGLAKKTKSASRGGPQTPKCQVESCQADLTHAKDYHRRHKVCNLHSKASTVVVSGSDQRFCQQCSRFHLLKEFDEGKRSCRKRLAGHNERRRKFQPDTSSWIHSYFFQGGTDSPPPFMSSGISFSWEDKCKFYPAHEIWPRMVKSVDQSTLDFSTGTAHFSHLSHKTHDYNDDEDKHPPFVLGQSLKGSSISQQGVHCYHYNDDHGQSSSPLMQGLTLTLPFSLGGAETHAGSRVPAGTDCALSLQQPPQSNNTTMTANSLMNPLFFQLNSLDTTSICPPIIGQKAYDVAPTSICPPMTSQQTYDVTTRKLNMIPPLLHMDKCISNSSGLLGNGSISNGDSFNDGYNNNHNASFLPSLNGVRSSSSCSSLEGIGEGQQVGSIMGNGRRLPPFCSPNFHATYCPPSSTMVQITEHGELQALHPFESTLYGSI